VYLWYCKPGSAADNQTTCPGRFYYLVLLLKRVLFYCIGPKSPTCYKSIIRSFCLQRRERGGGNECKARMWYIRVKSKLLNVTFPPIPLVLWLQIFLNLLVLILSARCADGRFWIWRRILPGVVVLLFLMREISLVGKMLKFLCVKLWKS
jgi:hypothetical protein